MDQSVFETYESEVRSYCRKLPTVFTKAKNATLTDQQGKTYIDFFCGAGACNYGHNNDYIKEKVMDYLAGDGILNADGQAHLAVKDLGGVALLGCHVEVAHGGGVLDEGVHIAQTGGQGQGGFRVLQMGDLLFQLVAVGAAEAGIGKAFVHMLVQIHGGIKVLQHIGAGLINGAHVGHGRRLVGAPQEGVDLLRVQNIIR